MALPEVQVKVTADTAQATANIDTLNSKLGTIPAASRKATTSARGFASSLRGLGNVSNQTRARIQNTSFQIQDIIVQLEMGTSVSRTMSQQLPQLAGGFGAVGAAIGVVVGLGIPFATMLFNAATGAEGAEEGVIGFSAALEALNKNIATTTQELDALRAGFNNVEDFVIQQKINDLLDEQKTLLLSASESSSRRRKLDLDAARALGVRITELKSQLSTQQSIRDEQEHFLASTVEAADAERLLGEQMITVAANTAIAAQEMQVLRDAAMEAAAEFTTMQALRSRFAGEDALMGMAVTSSGKGGPKKSRAGGGGGGDNGLDTLIDSLRTEQEIAEQFRAEGLALLMTASEAELEALGGINEAKLRLEQEYQDRLAGIKQQAADGQLALTLGAGSDVLSALGAFNDKAFKAAKVAAAAQALVSTFQGAAEALKLPFPANIAAAAAVTAKGLGLVAAIKGVSSSGGGGSAGGGAGAAAAPVAAQSPLDVNVSGIGGGGLNTGQLNSIFDHIRDGISDGRTLGNVSFS